MQKNVQGKTVERITFTEVTQKAVKEALHHPRAISDALVESYKARRALDFLVGFGISPVLWGKMVGSRSAGQKYDVNNCHGHVCVCSTVPALPCVAVTLGLISGVTVVVKEPFAGQMTVLTFCF